MVYAESCYSAPCWARPVGLTALLLNDAQVRVVCVAALCYHALWAICAAPHGGPDGSRGNAGPRQQTSFGGSCAVHIRLLF